MPPPRILPSSSLGGDALSVHKDMVLSRIHSDKLRAQHFVDLSKGVAYDLLLLTQCGGDLSPRLILHLLNTLNNYQQDFQFGLGIPGGYEAVLHSMNRLIESKANEVGLSMLLVDFNNTFNLIDRSETRICCPSISPWVEFCYAQPTRLYYDDSILWSCQGVQQGNPLDPFLFALILHPLVHTINCVSKLALQVWYLDDGTIVEDTLMVAKARDIIRADWSARGLFLNVDKTELFWPVEDPRSNVEGVFPIIISRPCGGVKLIGDCVSLDMGFFGDLGLKRVSKTIELIEVVNRLNDPQCELLLLHNCAGVMKLYYALRTCPLSFLDAQVQFDHALRISLEKLVIASRSGFGDWQWRLATLPIKLGGLGIFSIRDVIRYAFSYVLPSNEHITSQESVEHGYCLLWLKFSACS
ncbi:hypothetical protein V2J09_009112 [Rumex salicifolius]